VKHFLLIFIGDVRIDVKYQMHVKMSTRRKMTNFFGLIGISSKIPLTIYPIPLYEKLKVSDELYNYQDKDTKYKLYQMYLRFPKNCYEPGTKEKIIIKYRNPTVWKKIEFKKRKNMRNQLFNFMFF
jgi:hypothetical protein